MAQSVAATTVAPLASTLDTEGVVGNVGPLPLGTTQNSSVLDTSVSPGALYSSQTSVFPPGTPVSGTFDTEAVGGSTGGSATAADSLANKIAGTPDTQSQTGPGIDGANANPAYRAPNNNVAPAGTFDTTRT